MGAESRPGVTARELFVVLLFASLVIAAAATFVYANGWTLFYGDAEAHLNIARRIVDSRTPGPDQIGTVWLPLPHLLMLPFVAADSLWFSGAAGVIPSAICYVIALLGLYTAVKLALGSAPAAWAAAAVFGLNPNVLYLSSVPMTEPVFFAGFFGLLAATVWYARRGSLWAVIAAGFFSNWCSLTRYEGWFLIPFVAAYIFVAQPQRRLFAACLFTGIAGLAPAAWLAHNWWYFNNALEFYNGSGSAKAIQGGRDYPGKGDWAKSFLYVRTASALCAGAALTWIALAGVVATAARRAWWLLFLCALLPAFYIWSMHGSGTPIFVPGLWPNSYYNVRYGLAAMPLLAVAAAGLAAWGGSGVRKTVAAIVVGVPLVLWLGYPRPENWICWKESEVNSEARRSWTDQGANFLSAHYRTRDGVLVSFGDQIAILRKARIPLREALHDGNSPAWIVALQRPGVIFPYRWAISRAGDSVGPALEKVTGTSLFVPVDTWTRKGELDIRIWQRTHEHPVHEGARSTQRLPAELAK